MCNHHRTDSLINAIKLRPALYNKSDPMYFSHRKHKAKLWKEVCKELNPKWDHWKPQQRVEYQRELQRRWKSLRTCFSREVASRKAAKKMKAEGQPVRERKTYERFKQLLFLLDGTDETVDPISEDDCSRSGDDDPLDNHKMDDDDTDNDEDSYPDAKSFVKIEVNDPNPSESASEVHKVRVKRMDEIKEEDEDRQFMLSLVPSFRKLSDKKKFEVKIGFLNLLKDASFQNES